MTEGNLSTVVILDMYKEIQFYSFLCLDYSLTPITIIRKYPL